MTHRPEGSEVRSIPSEQVSVPKKIRTSFYAQSLDGQKTANGEIYQSDALTAAHRTYPFGTKLRLTNPENRKSVVVRVNDRGPFVAGRELDISSSAARALGMTVKGVTNLEMEITAP